MEKIAQFFKDKDGKVVVWQTPNIPLIAWAVAFALTFVPLPEKWHTLVSYIAFGFLFTWAWLEITQGSSGFRRTLGATVLLWLIVSRLI